MLPKLTETLQDARERASVQNHGFNYNRYRPVAETNIAGLPGYHPDEIAQKGSIEQDRLVHETRSRKKILRVGATILAAGGLFYGTLKYGNHEQIPWQHPQPTHVENTSH